MHDLFLEYITVDQDEDSRPNLLLERLLEFVNRPANKGALFMDIVIGNTPGSGWNATVYYTKRAGGCE